MSQAREAMRLVSEGCDDLIAQGMEPCLANLCGWLALRAARYRADVSGGYVRAGLPEVTPKDEVLPSPTAIQGETP